MLMIIITCIVAAAIHFSPISNIASAQEPADLSRSLATCAAIKGELERLQCFDDLTARSGLDGPQAQPTTVAGTGKWQVRHDINPIDDSERVTIALEADSGRSSFGSSISFVARCQSNKTDAYIVWNDYLGDDGSDVYNDWKNVTIRIGREKSSTQRWSVSTNSKATFAPDWAGDLLKRMVAADTFLAQVTPYNENPKTAIFDTRGMDKALEPLARACGWTVSQPARAPTSVHVKDEAPPDDSFSGLLRAVQQLDAEAD